MDCRAMGLKAWRLHSEMILLSHSIADLAKYAGSDCHLCSVFLIGIMSTSRVPVVRQRSPQLSNHGFYTTNGIGESIAARYGDVQADFSSHVITRNLLGQS